MSGKRAPGKRVTVAFRILPEELEDVDRRAKALRLTRTDYLIRAALRQPLGDEGTDERVDDLEKRLARIEELASYGG